MADLIDVPAGLENHCIVCGKTVDHGGGFAEIKAGEEMVALCCPLCLEAFQKDARTYLARRAVRQSHSHPPHEHETATVA
jgi:hypothetical protein